MRRDAGPAALPSHTLRPPVSTTVQPRRERGQLTLRGVCLGSPAARPGPDQRTCSGSSPRPPYGLRKSGQGAGGARLARAGRCSVSDDAVQTDERCLEQNRGESPKRLTQRARVAVHHHRGDSRNSEPLGLGEEPLDRRATAGPGSRYRDEESAELFADPRPRARVARRSAINAENATHNRDRLEIMQGVGPAETHPHRPPPDCDRSQTAPPPRARDRAPAGLPERHGSASDGVPTRR